MGVQVELVGLSLKCNICTGLRWDDILHRPWLCQNGLHYPIFWLKHKYRIHFWQKSLILPKFLGYLVPFEPYRPLLVPYDLGRVVLAVLLVIFSVVGEFSLLMPLVSFLSKFWLKFLVGAKICGIKIYRLEFGFHLSEAKFWL